MGGGWMVILYTYTVAYLALVLSTISNKANNVISCYDLLISTAMLWKLFLCDCCIISNKLFWNEPASQPNCMPFEVICYIIADFMRALILFIYQRFSFCNSRTVILLYILCIFNMYENPYGSSYLIYHNTVLLKSNQSFCNIGKNGTTTS